MTTALVQPKGIILILFPASRVAHDVFADRLQFVLVPDDVFVVATLPDGIEVGVCPKPFGDTDFEPTDD